MRTIRRCVFETNSSSCHSISIFNRDIWEKFQNGDIVFRPNVFDYNEHMDLLERFTDENFDECFMTFTKFYETTKEYIDEYLITNHGYMTSSQCKWENLKLQVLKDKISESFLKDILLQFNSSQKVESVSPPLEVEWSWGESVTIDAISYSDMFNMLASIWGYGIPESIYSATWQEDAKITNGDEIKFELDYQGTIENIQSKNPSYIVDLDNENKKIIIRNKGAEQITIEREVEC